MFEFKKKIKRMTGLGAQRPKPRRRRGRAYPWAEWSDQKLLDTRICDLCSGLKRITRRLGLVLVIVKWIRIPGLEPCTQVGWGFT